MAEPTLIAVIGAAGRMGRMILECAGTSEDPYHLVAAVDAADHPLIGHDLRSLLPQAPDDCILTADIPPHAPDGTVAIIYATPRATLDHLQWCEATGNGAVVGTTGFNEDQLAWIGRVSRRAPILLSPNTSVGVNVLFELAEQAVRMLGEGFDIEVVEMHHRHKQDAPSGTARKLAEIILKERGGNYLADTRHGRHGITGERTREELGMHALRGGDVVGDHTLILAGPGERIEITHRAHTRETFARGALRAASWLAGRQPGLYSMKDVLGL